MAMPKRFSQWDEKAPKDYDPDTDHPADSDSGSEDEAANLAGTEHYVDVGKSKLRQKDSVSLGPQYRGARVSRQALEDSDESQEGSEDFEDAHEALDSGEEDEDEGEDNESEEEYDDPETADLAADQASADEDAEIDSDNALVESDDGDLRDFVFRGSSKPRDGAVKRKKRPVAADFISSSGEESDNGGLDQEDEEETEDGDEDIGGAGLLDTEAEEETDQSASQDDDDDDEDDDEDDHDMDEASDLDGFIVGDDESESEQEEDEEDNTDEDDEDDEEDDDHPKARPSKGSESDARAEQRRLMNEGQKALVASITAAAQQDAKKGQAVRQQRKVFDGLLNLRIRLQKALVATNSFSAFDGEDADDKDSTPYQAAEEAALQLLATLDSVRASIVPAPMVGEKRKRDTEDNTSETLWQELQDTEERASKQRKKVLETWANKTKSTTVEVKSRNLIASRQSLVATLEDQLVNSDRLLKRARTPRSCAPLQVAKKVNEDATIYDDADFYQLLLKELVDQRTADETSGAATSGAVATVRWAAAMKDAKVKKQVDRRASKGRKLRFNIHEKLQNFMAPEDRRTWEQDAIDRLFGTLFGQKMELAEGGASDEEMDAVNAEEEGLRLFRN
ncbi:TRAUB-domain-containing protein [Sodiomyces alkalinus F11]|uniref:Protein BFR2 n=1 Tax=Sodiomyces alkalinus (strain CBS 110278 / VKM F-3762 / F11) TaxID=1314773 RepID=A0A3N2Q720_SODAK|nr:TRAUB-domain-containing protein [Sodiomyces alkalinus F11]ROT42516.1 TRAUB-domain-containing protein [Sodiomyces alkalinus F11]